MINTKFASTRVCPRCQFTRDLVERNDDRYRQEFAKKFFALWPKTNAQSAAEAAQRYADHWGAFRARLAGAAKRQAEAEAKRQIAVNQFLSDGPQ